MRAKEDADRIRIARRKGRQRHESPDGRKNEWSPKEVDDQLTAAFGDKKEAIVVEFKQGVPEEKNPGRPAKKLAN